MNNEKNYLSNPRATTVEELSTLWDKERRINHIIYRFTIKDEQHFTDIKIFFDNFANLDSLHNFGNLEPWSNKQDYKGPEYTPSKYDPSLKELTMTITALGDIITTTSDEYTPCYQIYRFARDASLAAQKINLELPEPYICRIPVVDPIAHRLTTINS